ncbi:putative immune-type receptor 7 precursor, partial [Clarias magur]
VAILLLLLSSVKHFTQKNQTDSTNRPAANIECYKLGTMITRFVALYSLLCLCTTVNPSDMKDLHIKTVKRGEAVSMECNISEGRNKNSFAWYRQKSGKMPQFLVRSYSNTQGYTFLDGFNDSRYSVTVNDQKFDLNINGIREDDGGEYFCGYVEGTTVKFTSGTRLQFEGEEKKLCPTPGTLNKNTHSVTHQGSNSRDGEGEEMKLCPTPGTLNKNTHSVTHQGSKNINGNYSKNYIWIIALIASNITSVIVIVVLVGILFKHQRKDASSNNHQTPTNQLMDQSNQSTASKHPIRRTMITRFVALYSLLCLCTTENPTDIKEFHMKTVKCGETVTMECNIRNRNSFSWYRQSFGKVPQFLVRPYTNTQGYTFTDGFNDSRFSVTVNDQKFDLNIIKIREDDGGEYFCGYVEGSNVKFTSGTRLQFEGEEMKLCPTPGTLNNNTHSVTHQGSNSRDGEGYKHWIIALTASNIISVIVIIALVGILFKNQRKGASSSNHQTPTNQ